MIKEAYNAGITYALEKLSEMSTGDIVGTGATIGGVAGLPSAIRKYNDVQTDASSKMREKRNRKYDKQQDDVQKMMDRRTSELKHPSQNPKYQKTVEAKERLYSYINRKRGLAQEKDHAKSIKMGLRKGAPYVLGGALGLGGLGYGASKLMNKDKS